jgi:outer membrane protein assembly factor BamE (lipoprotein component of BamABCDE complex)
VKVGSLITLAFLLSSWSCSYALRAPEITAGRAFHEEHLPRIHSGMAASEVQQLLGQPLEVRKDGSAEVWRYFVRSEQGESVRLLGIIPVPGPKWTGMREAIITIVDGSVVEIRVRQEPTSGPKSATR